MKSNGTEPRQPGFSHKKWPIGTNLQEETVSLVSSVLFPYNHCIHPQRTFLTGNRNFSASRATNKVQIHSSTTLVAAACTRDSSSQCFASHSQAEHFIHIYICELHSRALFQNRKQQDLWIYHEDSCSGTDCECHQFSAPVVCSGKSTKKLQPRCERIHREISTENTIARGGAGWCTAASLIASSETPPLHLAIYRGCTELNAITFNVAGIALTPMEDLV